MNAKNNKFKYSNAVKTSGWGIHFDSLTEVKFALSILEDHAFLRSPVSMYFHPGTFNLVCFPRLCHRRYTPDFLIRNIETGQATLIEIKPRAFEGQAQLDHHEIIATNYIRSMKFDWSYKVVFDDQIILTETQLKYFDEFLSINSSSGRIAWFQEYARRISTYVSVPFDNQNARTDFVMRGWRTKQLNLFST